MANKGKFKWRIKNLFWIIRANIFTSVSFTLSALLLLYLSTIAFLYFIDHTEADRVYILSILLSLIGGGSIILTIYTAVMAERINRKLLESQTIASEATSTFKTIFDRHLLKFINPYLPYSKKLNKVELILSTPAFGYHPLGYDECKEFINYLNNLKCEVKLVLYTPDAHFNHFLNTILWQDSDQAKHPNIVDYAFLLCDFFSVIREKIENSGWEVWISHQGTQRMFHFESSHSSHIFHIISDSVEISDDLTLFKGRSLPLPNVFRAAIVGEGDSMFNSLKFCPYSNLKDLQATIQSKDKDEFNFLLSDYLLGRTSNRIISKGKFEKDIDVCLENQKVKQGEELSRLSKILKNYVEYLSFLTQGEELQNSKNQHRIIPVLVDEKNIDEYKNIKKILEMTDPKDLKKKLSTLIESESKFKFSSDEELNRQDFINCIYYVCSKQFGNSQYYQNRISRTNEKN